ncbi:MAG: nucleotidyltransferase family protein [Guyparkeria sp.]
MRAGIGDPLRGLTIQPGADIRTAMAQIEQGEAAIVLVVDEVGRLLGTLSDGDLRRALLGGASMDDSIDLYVCRQPVSVPKGTDRAAVLDLMKARKHTQIPEIDEGGRLLHLHVMHEVLGSAPKPNRAVILAGGRGTRLGPLTSSTPKPMLRVAGRPIIERLVLHLVGSGIQHIYLSVSYLADQIADHFGDGSEFGCTIEYLHEDPEMPLGTGGPLRLLLDRDDPPREPLVVLNGDLVSTFSVQGILEEHERAMAAMTVAVREYNHDVPFGVVRVRDGLVERIDEKPRWSSFVNAGIYIVEPRLLDLIPTGRSYPITDLIKTCLERGELMASWQITDEWHDVGRPAELAHARGEV